MAQNTKSNKTINVWVNAGENAVVFNRKDGQEWARPLFVNLPNGVREKIAIKLGKVLTDANGKPVLKLNKTTGQMEQQPDFTKKAVNNCSFVLEWKLTESAIIKDGDNAGKAYDKFVVTAENLGQFLSQLTFAKRGAVSEEVKSVLDSWEPEILGADEGEDGDLEDF